MRTYYVPAIAFVIAGIPSNKAPGKDLDTAAYVDRVDHRKQG